MVVACNRDHADQTATTSVEIGADPNDTTIDRIAGARCAREIACNNVGSGKKWSDVGACRREMRQTIHGDYRQSECRVVSATELQSCISAIRDEKCDAVFDMTRVNACRKGNICKD